jgi:molecular chaperone IbpA
MGLEPAVHAGFIGGPWPSIPVILNSENRFPTSLLRTPDGSAVTAFIARCGMQADPKRQRRFQEDTMRHVDFSPLYRSTVGFDRLFTMLDSLGQPEQAQSYPPYNIERTGENLYRITMAVAGFDESELSIEAHAHVLTVKGEKAEDEKAEQSEFLYRGIAKRAFERRFQLADHVEVTAASLKNGLLHIDLLRNIPEAMKPRRISIAAEAAGAAPKAIEAHVN